MKRQGYRQKLKDTFSNVMQPEHRYLGGKSDRTGEGGRWHHPVRTSGSAAAPRPPADLGSEELETLRGIWTVGHIGVVRR